ncbi:hypothetical protein NDU88_010529 [Pleurodeles waltl]|uniref:Transposase n=1 Tax=Pleurodeles waltl TaxID=8319 RepID=A0AAV7R0G4_PLEWA|nr:hypothetical protein NDU88_010529 [Pleurodeles waltl]
MAKCVVRWRCRYRASTHNEEVTLGNKERGTEHTPRGLAGDIEGRSHPGLAENTLQPEEVLEVDETRWLLMGS